MSLVGVGVHQMWGLSSAFDCLDLMAPLFQGDEDDGGTVGAADAGTRPISVLLLQPADIRHVLKTIAQRRRHGDHGKRPIHVR